MQEFRYSRNKLHPTQKPVSALIPLIESFSRKRELVADPFCGSGSTCAAAVLTGRQFIGIELDEVYHHLAVDRMKRVNDRIAARRSCFAIYA